MSRGRAHAGRRHRTRAGTRVAASATVPTLPIAGWRGVQTPRWPRHRRRRRRHRRPRLEEGTSLGVRERGSLWPAVLRRPRRRHRRRASEPSPLGQRLAVRTLGRLGPRLVCRPALEGCPSRRRPAPLLVRARRPGRHAHAAAHLRWKSAAREGGVDLDEPAQAEDLTLLERRRGRGRPHEAAEGVQRWALGRDAAAPLLRNPRPEKLDAAGGDLAEHQERRCNLLAKERQVRPAVGAQRRRG